MNVKHLILLILLFPFTISAQDPIPELGPVFDNTVIPRIDITIDEQDLTLLLLEGLEFSNFEYPVTFIFNNGTVIDTLEDCGFRLRGNTSRTAAKKSFKVSFNTYVQGQQYYGLDKMNLNGEHNDPTISRARLNWELLRDIGVPGPRANHIELYINGDYFGLYANVEHIDEEFLDSRFGNNSGNLYKCLWPATLNFEGLNPEVYKEEFYGRRAYELKTNIGADNYSDLATFIHILNNTPLQDLSCELEKIFNVDSYLKAMAFEILMGHWDNYIFNKNNFYLYRNIETGQFEYIPFDLDNTLGVNFISNFDFTQQNIYNWEDGSSDPKPLYTRILQIPEYRNRFSYYMKSFIDSSLDFGGFFPLVDGMKDQIQASVMNDPLHSEDYGFTFSEFNQNFDGIVDYWFVTHGIKSFIEARKISANQQLVLNNIDPVIYLPTHNCPDLNETIEISVEVFDDESIESVMMYYEYPGEAEQSVELFDDGLNNDGIAGDMIYGISVPGVTLEGDFKYRFEVTDNNNQTSIRPACDAYYIYFGTKEYTVKINEFMARNTGTISDDYGEFADWIELHNYGNTTISLEGKFLTDDKKYLTKWQMPDVFIPAGGYLLFWADKDQEQGALHTNFKLSANGEEIIFSDAIENNYAPLDRFVFGPQDENIAIGRIPNGMGDWQTMDVPSPGESNEPVSVEEINLVQFNFYPNPASDQIYLSGLEENAFPLIWSIYDFSGQKILEGSLINTDQSINVIELSVGAYLFQIGDDLDGRSVLVVQ